ncbi:MAG: hypothetical protein ACKOEY_00120 [Phenylobacterium sp.]
MNFRNLGIWAAIILALAGSYALMNPNQRSLSCHPFPLGVASGEGSAANGQ